MPAASKQIKYTYVPKGAGRGGMFSNSTSHDGDTDTLDRVNDLLIDGGQWCPRPAETVFSNALPGWAQAMFIYNFYNEISTIGTSALLADSDTMGGLTDAHGVYRVQDLSAGIGIIWGPLGQLPNGVKPRVNFASVKNRCFMTSGRGLGYFDQATQVTAGLITTWTITSPATSNLNPSMVGMIVLCDDGAGGVVYVKILTVPGGGPTYPTCTTTKYTPAGAGPHDFYIGYDTPVIYDGTAGAGTGRTYNWGFLGQTTNLTYHIGDAPLSSGIGNGIGTATASVGAAPFTVTWASGDKFDALSPGQNFYMNGYNWEIESVNSPTSITLYAGSTPPPIAPAFGGAGPFTFQAGMGMLITSVTTVSVGLSSTVTWTAGDPFFPVTGGLPFLKVGDVVYIAGLRAIVQAIPIPTIVLVIFDGPAAPVDGPWDFVGDFGPLEWDVPGSTAKPTYKYMVSYWDPITGHASNGSPAVEVIDRRPYNSGGTVTLSGIETNGDSRFTQIVISRTTKGGGVFKPLAVRPNTGGPLKYVDSQNDDTKLGTVGPGDFRMEQSYNKPPPNTGGFIAYWDGRFWMADNSAIGVVFMSKTTQEMEGIVGVAEECWPQNVTYQRTIPDSDGRITGLRTVGENLFIMTDLAVYAVVGQGLSPTSYALQRISAKGSGTTSLASATLPAEDSQSGDVLVHFGNDNRMYFLYGQGSDLAYSYPIQDKFTYPPGFPNFWWKPDTTSIGVLHDRKATYVLVSKTNAVEPPSTFLYDLDRKVWLETTIPPYSYYEGLYNNELTHLVAGSPYLSQPKTIYRAMNDGTLSTSSVHIETQFANVPGTNRLDDKILQAVFVYCDDTTVAIDVSAYVDEKDSFLDEFKLVRMPTIDPNYLAYLEAPNARIYQPAGNVIVRGRTFKIKIIVLGGVLNQSAKIPAFAPLWSHAEADDNIGGNL